MVDNIICPTCGCATAYIPILFRTKARDLGHPDVNNLKFVNVLASMQEPSVDNITNYAILECQDCRERIVVQNGKHAHEDHWVVVYPIPHKIFPEEIPEPIKSEIQEASLCLGVNCCRACVLMCQRVLESICQEKKVPGLNELRDKGFISGQLFDRATEIRLWAGMLKHKVLDEAIGMEDTEELLSYLEMIIDETYVCPARLEELKVKRKLKDGKK